MARRPAAQQKKSATREESESASTSSGDESVHSDISENKQEELQKVIDEVDATSSSDSEEVAREEGSAPSEETGSGEEEEKDDETMRTIFVKGIDYDLRESDLREQMEKIGQVVRVFIPLTHDNRRNKGFAYVEFKKLADSQKALKLNNTVLLGRKVMVDQAKPRSNFKIFTVFCKNLSFDTTRDEIIEHFKKYGPAYNVSLPIDSEHEGRNRGFCFLEYKDEETASRVAGERHVIKGRNLIVSLGNKNDDRNSRRSSDRLYGRRNNDRPRRNNRDERDDSQGMRRSNKVTFDDE